MHYGIWNEAWEACCRAHNIDITPRERERSEEAAKNSFYAKQDEEEGVEDEL